MFVDAGRWPRFVAMLIAFGPAIGSPSAGESPPSAVPPCPGREDLRRFVAGRDEFALALLRSVLKAGDGGNVVLAPHGLAETMAIAYEGAAGETARQIAGTLRFGGPAEAIASSFDQLAPSRPRARPSLRAELASNDGYGVKVTGVPAGSAAERAGLHPGDLILAVDDQPVRARPRLLEMLDRSDGTVRLQTYDFPAGRVVDRVAVLDEVPPPEDDDSGPPSLTTSRSVWIQAGTSVSRQFRESARGRHHSQLFQVDFREQHPEARSLINAWFAERAGRDQAPILADCDLEADTRLVLLDAVAFRGRWATPFPPATPGTFRPAAGAAADVPMMHRAGRFYHARDEEFNALELPYAGGALSMMVILPIRRMSLGEIASSVSADHVAALAKGFKPRNVEVALPKFHVHRSLRLERDLSILGMARAFSRDAEFPGIDPDQPLRLSVIRQEASINVDESGTRIDATTAASGVLIKGGEAQPLTFHADHPFLFVIRDQRTGYIVFAGGISHP